MREEQKAWLAGLFEGEGCFFINTIKKRGKEYRYASACLVMTDEDVVRLFHRTVGFGRVRQRSKPRKEHWKPTWTWYVHGEANVRKLFSIIGPYLMKRRTATYRKVLRGSGATGRRPKLKPS